MIQFATDTTFDEMIKEGFVIVDFFQDQCQPCRMLDRVLDDLEDEMPFVNIVKINANTYPTISQRYQVSGVPDVFFFKDGELVFHQVGLVSDDELKNIIKKFLYK